ncbi:MAG: tetratricopeptide repeat protein [Candidatus Zixiibacteriota bacterium]|nr:MAG: tetratricopeptide repeat protein [candidate division Zixibacteria bacterium]
MGMNLTAELSAKGYWPAVALEYFSAGKYSKAVALCSLRLKQGAEIVSGRLILARALYHSGQQESAEDEFYKVLRRDPENPVALKYLGDIKFAQGDEATAFSYYGRILEIEPRCSGLTCPVVKQPGEVTKILSLKRGEEKSSTTHQQLRELPLRTETAGDLLLAQGHPRLALVIFRELAEKTGSPRIAEKAEKLQATIKNGRE